MHQGSVAFGGHAVSGGLALDVQDVVGSLVGVVSNGQVVGAFGDDVHAGVQRVVSGQEVLGHFDSHDLALAGLQQLGLAVANELDGGLFDLPLLVVLGVGLLGVDLHGLLAGGLAGVGDLHGHGVGRVGAILSGGLVSLGGDHHDFLGDLVFLGNGQVRHLEGGVAQAVAEGIANHVLIGELAGVGGAQDDVLIAGLGVLVAQVDAFLVHNVLVVTVAHVVLVGAGIGVGAEVVLHGVEHVIDPPGIRQRTGGGDSAGDHVAHGPQTGLADGAHPQGGVNGVILVLQEVHGDGVGAVDDDGDGGDVALVLQFSQAFQDGLLFFVQLEVVVVQHVVEVVAGHVVAFAADTANHEDDMLAHADGVVAVFILVVALDLGPLLLADLVVVALQLVLNVPVQQGLVGHVEAGADHHVVVVGGAVGVHSAGAGAAVDGIHHGDADQGHVSALVQGQDVVIILQQNDTFALHLADQRVAGSLQLLNGGVDALVVALVAFVHSAFLHDDLGGGGLEELMHLARVGRSDGAAGVDHDAQHGHDIQEHFFQCSVLGSLHYYIVSFRYGVGKMPRSQCGDRAVQLKSHLGPVESGQRWAKQHVSMIFYMNLPGKERYLSYTIFTLTRP